MNKKYMTNIKYKIHKRQKEETLRTLIKLYCDYDDYLTNEFFPVWGIDLDNTPDCNNEKLNEIRSILEGDHPFFE